MLRSLLRHIQACIFRPMMGSRRKNHGESFYGEFTSELHQFVTLLKDITNPAVYFSKWHVNIQQKWQLQIMRVPLMFLMSNHKVFNTNIEIVKQDKRI